MNPWLCAGTPPGVALLSLAGLSPEFGKNAFLWAYESSGQQVEATRKRKWGGDRVGIGEKEENVELVANVYRLCKWEALFPKIKRFNNYCWI